MSLPPHTLPKAAAALSLAAFAGGAAAYAMLYPDSQLCGPVLVAPRRPGEIALTFDDGPNPLATPRLLDVLARHSVRATFFLIGANVRREPALTRAIADAGHAIGNHTLSHPWLTLLAESRIRAEILGCSQAVEDIVGARVSLFRPPHGARRPAVLRIARELGLTTVQWNVIAHDWLPVPPAVLLERIGRGLARNRRRGLASNVVLHDGGHAQPRLPTVEAVDQLLTRLRSRPGGPDFVTPDAWLKSPDALLTFRVGQAGRT